MRNILAILVVVFFSLFNATAQETYQLEEMFLDADSWFYYEDYPEALPIFLKLYESDSLNYNVIYKIGFCYLHIDGQKSKSIPFLKKATERITDTYRENNYVEKRAPIDAFFYLGNAYLVNNQIEQAIDSYMGFQKIVAQSKKLADKDIYDQEYLTRQINACKNAIEFKNNPVEFIAENAGTPINTKFDDFNPVISGDGNVLIFTTKLKFYDAIFYSKKVNGEWSYPVNIMSQLGVDNKTATSSLSYDGKILILYRDDNFDGNLYVSFFKNGEWTKIAPLGENINTKYWESNGSLSKDNTKLYFTSNRVGGYGDLDIYVSDIQPDGTWGIPKNLGPVINSRWNENSPFVTENGYLFFTSEGHKGMGGYDVFYSIKTGNTWSEPKNMGYPLNTTDDNIFFYPVMNAEYAYYAKYSGYGYGGEDIYKVILSNFSENSPLKIEAILSLNNEVQIKQKDFKINIFDSSTSDTIAILSPDKDLDENQFRTPLGEDHLFYESIRAANGKQYLISLDYNTRKIFLASTPKKEIAATENLIDTLPGINLDKDIYSTNTDDENVKIKLSLQKGNKLFVSTFYNENLINSEEFDINKRDEFIYEYKPREGESKIRFKLIDDKNRISTQEVTVSYIPQDKNAIMNIDGKVINLADGQKDIKIKLSVEKDS
ncbi:MAG: hypothetical protein RBT49_12325, partial [Bacteroidales bacterium]|nr:hypothetical protein [Bacteroidales bacterium]